MRSVRVIRMFLYSIREIYAYKDRSATLLLMMCLKSHSTLPPFFISQFPESLSAHRTGRETYYGTKIYRYTIFNRLSRVAVFTAFDHSQFRLHFRLRSKKRNFGGQVVPAPACSPRFARRSGPECPPSMKPSAGEGLRHAGPP